MRNSTVEITIPVLNEEIKLGQSISRLVPFLNLHCRFNWRIIIVDNGSTDGTLEIAHSIAQSHPNVQVVHLEEAGRGAALKVAWSESTADIVSYMDVDLSSSLFAFPALIELLLAGGFDIAIGSRLLKPALTARSFRRESISRVYNLILKAIFRPTFSDAQCGFKAMRASCARRLLPYVTSPKWFFDTELLVLADLIGLRIFEMPVPWVENGDSRVHLIETAIDDLRCIAHLRRRLSLVSGKGGLICSALLEPLNCDIEHRNQSL